MSALNLDVLLGESSPRPLTYKTQTFDLPGELPAAALAPFLSPQLGLLELLAEVLGSEETAETEDDGVIELVFKALKAKPMIPADLLEAGKESLAVLLGDRYEEFLGLNPSVPAYFLLAKGIATEYGMSLADFFGSAESSSSSTESSPQTSSTTTDSTPELSGTEPTPATSDSDDSSS